jgi:putative protease
MEAMPSTKRRHKFKNNVELLAPAGNLEKAKTAILYGANAVYIGGQQFSLRSRASNFSLEDIQELCIFAHGHNAAVHVTVNIIPHPDDLDHLKEYLQALDDAGVDAIIAASAAIIQTAKSINPSFEIHLSTQHSTINASAVKFWKKQGVDRVVLGREANLEQIASICKENILPIEVFIHGGMCISYSGRCVLSNHMTNRDANRGGCAQSCRWKYDVFDGDQIISDQDIPFSMSSRDLQSVPFLKDLIEAGAISFKIEGRMKSAYYLATVVSSYRRLIDEIFTSKEQGKKVDPAFIERIQKEIAKAENRPTGPGFYAGLPKGNVQLYRKHDEQVTQEYIAQVLEVLEDGWLKVQVKNRFFKGDSTEIFGPDLLPAESRIEEIENMEGESLDVCPHPMEIVKIKMPGAAQVHAMIRKTGD